MATDAPTPNADGSVDVMLDLGHAGDETFLVRVTPDAAMEMRELMEAEGVFSGEILEFSAGSDLAIWAGSIAGGLSGLAAALRAYFHRNQHRAVTFSHGDVSVELKGCSEDEIKRLIDQALEEMHHKQLQRDREWRRISGRDIRDG